jgi:hypothetical protein
VGRFQLIVRDGVEARDPTVPAGKGERAVGADPLQTFIIATPASII